MRLWSKHSDNGNKLNTLELFYYYYMYFYYINYPVYLNLKYIAQNVPGYICNHGSLKGIDQEKKHVRWNRRQLPGMKQTLAGIPEVWLRDAASRSLRGTMVTYVTWDVPLQELEMRQNAMGTRCLCSQTFKSLPSVYGAQLGRENRRARAGLHI